MRQPMSNRYWNDFFGDPDVVAPRFRLQTTQL